MPDTKSASGTRQLKAMIESSVQSILGLKESVVATHREARQSGVPGASGGPQDAYRHMLITAELVRIWGDELGPEFAKAHELGNEVASEQSARDRAMDEHNNALAVEIGRKAETWDDVVRLVREKISDSASHDGDGKNGTAVWYRVPADPGWAPDWGGKPIAPNAKGGADRKYVPLLPEERNGEARPESRNPVRREMRGMRGEADGKPAVPANPRGATDRRPESRVPAMTPAARAVERFALAGEETLDEVLRKPAERLTDGEIDRLIAEKSLMRLGDPLRGPAEKAVAGAFRHAFPGGSSPARPPAAEPAAAVSPDGRPVAEGVRNVLGRFIGGADDETLPAAVATLQDALNRAAPEFAPLKRDGAFGSRTRARLRGVVARRGARPALDFLPADLRT